MYSKNIKKPLSWRDGLIRDATATCALVSPAAITPPVQFHPTRMATCAAQWTEPVPIGKLHFAWNKRVLPADLFVEKKTGNMTELQN